MPEQSNLDTDEFRARLKEAQFPEQAQRELVACNALDHLDVAVEAVQLMVGLVVSVPRSIDEGTTRDQILLRWSASNELLMDSFEVLRTRARTGSDAFRTALGLWPSPIE